MKYFLSLVIFTSLLTSCTNHNPDDIKYGIYSGVLNKQFGQFSPNIPYIIGINDTITDFKTEFGILIYSVKNNYLFFNEHCKGDTSFKSFIFSIKTINTNKEVMDIEKLKSKTKLNINLNKLIKGKDWHHSINFSKVVVNKTNDKAILFITGQSSGSWYFVEFINKKWIATNIIPYWVI